MKKIVVLLALLTLGSASVSATALRPINVQNAYIDTDNKYEARINFDWFNSHTKTGIGSRSRASFVSFPRLDIRRSFETEIPTRIGLSASFGAGGSETGLFGAETEGPSAVGFGNLGISLEAALVNEEEGALTAYINQTIPLVHSDALLNNTLRPLYGANAYGFQTGFEYQFDFIDEAFVWHGDVAYRFDVPDNGEVEHSLVYWNEMVVDTGSSVNLSLGLLGTTVFNSSVGADATDLRLVPGIIAALDDEATKQFRIGVPIGLNEDTPDFGIQASFFSTF